MKLEVRGLLQRASILIWLATLSLVVPCNPVFAGNSERNTSETDELNTWLNQKYREGSRFDPLTKAYFGVKDEDSGSVNDFSSEGYARALDWQIATTEELKSKFKYEALSSDGKTSYDFWIYLTGQTLAEDEYRSNALAFSQNSFSAHTMLNQLLISWHRVDQPADMENYVTRISETARALNQLVEQAEMRLQKGIVPPAFTIELVLRGAETLLDGKPFKDVSYNSPVWGDVLEEVEGLVQSEAIDRVQAEAYSRRARQVLISHWGPAQKNLILWLKKNQESASGFRSWLPSLAEGEAFYAERLAYHTTTDLSASEIHELGLANVARLHTEIRSVMKTAGIKGSLQQLFQTLPKASSDPRHYYPNTDEGRQAYLDDTTDLLANVQAKLPQFFGLLPKADLIVKRVEAYREQAGGAAHYVAGSPDGSRPGTYYVHLIDMDANAKYEMEAIAYHEVVPGHHMQFGIANELEGLPEFRKRALITAHFEGWSLYAEGLAAEIPGTYQDPYARIGRLNLELFRAVRLVVDTGLHAMNWTGEEAMDYIMENSMTPLEVARSEVRRYIADPGQATAYMVGMLKIRELRRQAEAALGEKFDIRTFHDLVLGQGSLPLQLLERNVVTWIAAQ